MQNKYLYFSLLFFMMLTLCSLQMPFFWDGTFFSEIALNYYTTGFENIVNTNLPDTGGFPMYSIYMALMWKIFGKSLVVSHLALFPFVAGIALQYFRLAKRFLAPAMMPFAFLLLVCEPCLSTQTALMGYDLLMIFFFLSALNALLSGRDLIFAIVFTLLCMSSMRGIILGAGILLIDLSIYKKLNYSLLKKYIPAVLIFLCWSLFHYQKTGWFFFSPQRENTDEALVSFSQAIRNLFFIGWKISDIGRITLWFFFIVAGIIIYGKKEGKDLHLLLKIICIPLLVCMLCMIPLSNPVGHKYFIVVFLLLNIGVCYLLQFLESKKTKIMLVVLFSASLIGGNFILYPERYGNAWDSSLKVLPYFSLKEEMDHYTATQKIDPAAIGTQYPLISDKRFSHLQDSTYAYTNVWRGPLHQYDYFLQSNVINTDIPKQIEEVKRSWILLKKLEKGQVYISLYKNPR